MPDPAASYSNGIYRATQLYAGWPPNANLRLGDIGTVEGKLLRYRSNLDNMGVSFTELERPAKQIDHDYSYGFETAANVGAAGEAISVDPIAGKAKAGFIFDRSGAFIFQGTGAREHEIDDKLKLANQITRLYINGIWDKDWVVVESLLEFERATIIVANSDRGQFELSAEGGFPAGAVPLAKVQGGIAVTRRSGDISTYLAKEGLTPMFGLIRPKRSWLDVLKDLLGRGSADGPPPVERAGDALEWHREWPEVN